MIIFRKETFTGARNLSQHFLESTDEDPLGAVANLFDVAMVFSVALILALFTALRIPELLTSKDEVVVVRRPGKIDMEIIKRKGVKLEKYRMTSEEMGGEGERLGICYRLANGDVVYVPEEATAAETGAIDSTEAGGR